ncbi:hypothetical protein [Paratractidigestivibacter sp.]|uniref:hypothetical protein n=1 Tax=Paratractidigestivibacter sp. TaxID=2847316 RepID=UPI002AC8A1A8|nr:hypothetical protein [Paratractidigestivibacter sp.]
MIARAADEAAAAAGLPGTRRDAVLLVDVITGLPDGGATGEEEGFFVVAVYRELSGAAEDDGRGGEAPLCLMA